MPATVFDKPIFPGARIVTANVTISNTSGNYTNTVQDNRITASMEAYNIEIDDPSVFRDKITVTTVNGSFTISCPSVEGETTVKISFIKIADDPQAITSVEYDTLNNRIGDLDELETTEKTNVVDAVNEIIDTKPDYATDMPISSSDATKVTEAIAKLGQPAAESSTYNSLDSFKSGLISIVSGMNNGEVRKIRFGFSVTSIVPFKGYTWTCEITRATASYFAGIAYTYGTDVRAVEIKYYNGTWSIEQLESKITTVLYTDLTATNGVCTVQYPTGMSDTSHTYIVQPIYRTGNLLGWSHLIQMQPTHINLYVRIGSTTPANDSKVTFKLTCIKN